MNFFILELNDTKSTTKTDTPVDHHQHNGNIKNTTIYSEVSEKKNVVESQSEKVVSDDDNNKNDDIISKISDTDITIQEEPTQQNVEEVNRDVDEYKHSIWKWPSGRSKFTKVSLYCTSNYDMYIYKIFLLR